MDGATLEKLLRYAFLVRFLCSYYYILMASLPFISLSAFYWTGIKIYFIFGNFSADQALLEIKNINKCFQFSVWERGWVSNIKNMHTKVILILS